MMTKVEVKLKKLIDDKRVGNIVGHTKSGAPIYKNSKDGQKIRSMMDAHTWFYDQTYAEEYGFRPLKGMSAAPRHIVIRDILQRRGHDVGNVVNTRQQIGSPA